jgi:hypothetical protein
MPSKLAYQVIRYFYFKQFFSPKANGDLNFEGVLILPQSLRQSTNTQHQQWTLIGLEDQVTNILDILWIWIKKSPIVSL